MLEGIALAVEFARQGKRVLWVEEDSRMVWNRFVEAEEIVADDAQAVMVLRANGQERIKFKSGGRLIFASVVGRRVEQRIHGSQVLFVSPLALRRDPIAFMVPQLADFDDIGTQGLIYSIAERLR